MPQVASNVNSLKGVSSLRQGAQPFQIKGRNPTGLYLHKLTNTSRWYRLTKHLVFLKFESRVRLPRTCTELIARMPVTGNADRNQKKGSGQWVSPVIPICAYPMLLGSLTVHSTHSHL